MDFLIMIPQEQTLHWQNELTSPVSQVLQILGLCCIRRYNCISHNFLRTLLCYQAVNKHIRDYNKHLR